MKLSSLISQRALMLKGLFHYHQPEGRHPHPMPIPEGYERVELVTGGRGWVLNRGEAGEWIEVNPGDILWNQAGDFTIGRSDWENPYRCLSLTLELLDGPTPLGLPRLTRWEALEEVERFARKTADLFYHNRFDRDVLWEYVRGQLLFHMELHLMQEDVNLLPEPLRLALDEMEAHYMHPCRIGTVAQVAGCSVPHLHALFRQHLQSTPHQWLIQRRLRAAREKLASTQQPIKQIAVESGFPDTAAFANTFRQRIGITPSRYREQARHLATEGA